MSISENKMKSTEISSNLLKRKSISSPKPALDYATDIAIFMLFVSTVTFFDNKQLLLFSVLIYLGVMFLRFIVKQYKIDIFTIWGILITLNRFSSVFYSIDPTATFYQSFSATQPIIYAILIIPYLKNAEANLIKTLKSLLIAASLMVGRLLITIPREAWGLSRIGVEINYNANTVGFILSMSGIISLFLFKYHNSKQFLIFSGLFIFFSLFSGSRKALAVLFVGILIIMSLSIKNKKRLFLSFGLSIILVGFLYYAIINIQPLYEILGRRVESFISIFTGSGKVDNSTNTRISMIARGYQLFLEKPLFGYGLGTYTFLGGFGMYSHNNYIEMLVSVGLIGTLIYYFMPMYILVKGTRLLLHFQFRNMLALLTCLLSGIILMMDVGMVSYYEEFPQIILAISYSTMVVSEKVPNLRKQRSQHVRIN